MKSIDRYEEFQKSPMFPGIDNAFTSSVKQVLKEHVCDHDARRVFLSDEKDDNALNCIVEKVRILCIPPKVGLPIAEKEILGFDLYYDMTFSVAYSSFSCLPSDVWMGAGGTSSTITTCIPSDVSDGS